MVEQVAFKNKWAEQGSGVLIQDDERTIIVQLAIGGTKPIAER